MDRTDYQILNILQEDCQTTLKQIGAQVSLTAPAVSERICRMEEKQVIEGFHASVDRERLGYSMTGFIFVALEPDKYDSFCDFCKKNTAITAHYHVIGVFNALLRFAVQNTRELDQLLSLIKRYGDSQTSVSLNTYFEGKAIPLPEKG